MFASPIMASIRINSYRSILLLSEASLSASIDGGCSQSVTLGLVWYT